VYSAEFPDEDYERNVNDYTYAGRHSLKYLRVSYRLLKIATAYESLPIKLWSLLPDASHFVVHAPFSGERAFYYIFQRARRERLPIPDTIRDDGNDNGLITLTAFQNRYRDVTERRRI
jgi:hypothetical protein